MKKKLDLVVLNQRPMVKQAIKQLENWHNKIELLEIEIQKFNDTDFKPYNDWLSLISTDLHDKNNVLINEYKQLVLFHNWIVFTKQDKNISLPHAFFLMSEEELAFQKSSESEKERIIKIRLERTEKIKTEFESSDNDHFEDKNELDSDENRRTDKKGYDDFQENNFDEKEEIQIRLMRKKFQKEILFFELLSDKKIIKKMRQFEEAINLLSECLFICSNCYRFDLVERIWSFAPIKIKNHFNADFKKQMGLTLDQYLLEVKRDAQNKSNSNQDDGEFNFKAHFENPFSITKEEVLPENLELAKILYRRIMMRIHPDKLSIEFVTTKKSWLDRLWKKIQAAYAKSDAKALQKLYLQVMVTLKKYDDLDYSELITGSELLKSEFARLEKSNEDTLQHPAWGFSKLKSYKKLEKLAAEPYVQTSKEIKKDIKRLQGTHAALKEFADSVLAKGGFGKRKQRKSPPVRKGKQRANGHQFNLF